MKILYLITKSEIGGAQTHIYELCKYFCTKHDITVVACPGGWLEDECRKLDITFIANTYFSNNLNPLQIIRSYLRIKQITNDVQPDIVHCHSSVAGFIGRLAIRNKIPTVFTAHGWGFNIGVKFFQKWIVIIAEKLVSQYTAKIICVSKFVKDLALTYRIASKKKLKVIYNGVETQQNIQDDIQKSIDIVFVGRLAAPKRPDILLQATHMLPRDTRIQIIGSGPLQRSTENYIRDHGLSSQVIIRGELKHDEMFATLQKSKILVLFSDWEGFPMTILEAMSAGVPVVASEVGGIAEIVCTGYNGFLCKKTDSISQIAGLLNILLHDEELRLSMGKSAQKTVKERFIIARMVEETEKIYTQLVT